RHETGKPMILIIRKGDRIPFDLAGIRTIGYDLSDPRKTRESVLQVQEFVKEVERNGFAEVSSGATLTTVIDTLGRIERKLSTSQFSPASVNPGGAVPPKTGIPGLMRSPMEALQDALMAGDISAVVQMLPRVERALGLNSQAVVTAAAVAA